MANSSTKTILESMEWAKQFVYNRILSLGNFKEPLITSVNNIKQTILGRPFRWQFNRVVTGFVATAGVQDYTLGNWAANTAFALAFRVIDTNGNSQRVTTAGTSGGSAPSWNPTAAGTTTDGTVVWTNDGSIPNSSSSFTYGWIENASVKDISLTPSKWFQISSKVDLALDSSSARPQNISAELDTGNGNIVFRVMPVPAAAYPIAITLQQKASLVSSLNGTWAPIPDEFGYIYQIGLLSYVYEFADDTRWVSARQRFIASLLGAAEGLSETEKNIFLQGMWQPITGQPVWSQIQLQQGNQGRGV